MSTKAIINEFDYLNVPCNRNIKTHCQKCGRRCRNNKLITNNCKQRLFPRKYSASPLITSTDEYRSVSVNVLNRNSSEKPSKKEILIDQLIQVQQINYSSISQTDSIKCYRAQQMIYLRENINNLSYREVHFAHKYIILKRLEEKNKHINQNYFQADQYFRLFKLQYQTNIILCQYIPIKSFIYSNDPTHIKSVSVDYQLNLKNVNTIHYENQYNLQQHSKNAFVQSHIIENSKKLTNKTDMFQHINSQNFPSNNFANQIDHSMPKTLISSSKASNNVEQFDNPMFHLTNNLNSDSSQYVKTKPSAIEDRSSVEYSNLSERYSCKMKTIEKIKKILEKIQSNLIHKKRNSFVSRQISNSTEITIDSLISNTSVQSNSSLSTIVNFKNEINYLKQEKYLNLEKNRNRNQQTTDDEQTKSIFNYTHSQSNRTLSQDFDREYMPASFMFVLQLLLVICLINRFLMYFIFGTVSNDNFTSITTNQSEATKLCTENGSFTNFLLIFFNLI